MWGEERKSLAGERRVWQKGREERSFLSVTGSKQKVVVRGNKAGNEEFRGYY